MNRLDVGGGEEPVWTGPGDDRRQVGQSADCGRHAAGEFVHGRQGVVRKAGRRWQGSLDQSLGVGLRAREQDSPDSDRLFESRVARDQREQPTLAGGHDGGLGPPQAGVGEEPGQIGFSFDVGIIDQEHGRESGRSLGQPFLERAGPIGYGLLFGQR